MEMSAIDLIERRAARAIQSPISNLIKPASKHASCMEDKLIRMISTLGEKSDVTWM